MLIYKLHRIVIYLLNECYPIRMQQLSTADIANKCQCSNFIGVFAIDALPPARRLPNKCKFIVNTQPHNLPGEHWLAVYGNIIFDPLGICYPETLVDYLLQRYDNIKTNHGHHYQSVWDSKACGYFCLYFLHYGVDNLLDNAFFHNLRIISSSVFH